MAQFVVRDLEEEVKVRLKRLAERHGRSMEEEIRHILRNAAKESGRPVTKLGSRISGRFLRPERAFWPLVPRPAVLPRFPPRPTRVLLRAVMRLSVLSEDVILFFERDTLERFNSRARVVYWILAA